MACQLLLEKHPPAESLGRLVDVLDRGELVRRTVELPTGAVDLDRTEVLETLELTPTRMACTFEPGYRMLLIGLGQLAEFVAKMALFNGFAVTLCDPREEFVGSWSVQGVTVKRAMPDDVVLAFKADSRSCVIALTHDPKLDDLALMEAPRTQAFYVGAIGSRRNSQQRAQRLHEHFDLTREQLGRLRGPVGLYIGSKMPAEIAVSIMAEVLAVKNGVALPSGLAVGQAKSLIDADRRPAVAGPGPEDDSVQAPEHIIV